MRRVLILTFAAALLAAPAFAGDDKEGWYIGIEGSSVQAGNADVVLGTETGAGVLPDGKFVTLDYGSGAAYQILVGYRNANADCALSYWSYDEDDSLSVTSADGFLNALTTPNFGFDTSNQIDATGTLETHTADITWARPIAKNDRSHFSWLLGIREWQLEQQTSVIYDQDAGIPDNDLRVRLHTDADGIGLVAGLGAKYHFTDRFWGSTSLRLAFLTGSMDSMTEGNELGNLYSSMLDNADRNYRQTELDTRINFNVAAGFDLYLGYQHRDFDAASERVAFVDDIQDGAVVTTVSPISFSGISLGASYTF